MKIFTKTLITTAVTLGMGNALAAPYEIIDLGKIEGGTNSFAYGINDAGEVVGYGDGPLGVDSDGNEFLDFTSHGIQFLSPGIIDLGELEGGRESFALSINNNGVIVGYSDEVRVEEDDAGEEQSIRENFAVIFNSGTLNKIPGLDSLTGARAFDINDNNYVVGTGQFDLDAEDSDPAVERGFVVNSTDGTELTVLPSLTPESTTRTSTALSINNNGQIVGWSQQDQDSGFVARAFLTTVANAQELTELPNIDTPYTVAIDINNNGVIIGFAQAANNTVNTISFVYNPETDTELTTLPYFSNNFNSSKANAINDSGQIVGQALVSAPSTGLNTGYLYEDNELKDLNNLIPCDSGWRIDNATNINNMGEIIGYGLRAEVIDGETVNEVRAFKLKPTGGSVEVCETPDEGDNNEPSGGSWSFFSLSLLALFGIRRKYK